MARVCKLVSLNLAQGLGQQTTGAHAITGKHCPLEPTCVTVTSSFCRLCHISIMDRSTHRGCAQGVNEWGIQTSCPLHSFTHSFTSCLHTACDSSCNSLVRPWSVTQQLICGWCLFLVHQDIYVFFVFSGRHERVIRKYFFFPPEPLTSLRLTI
jgi:hypothetical protein